MTSLPPIISYQYPGAGFAVSEATSTKKIGYHNNNTIPTRSSSSSSIMSVVSYNDDSTTPRRKNSNAILKHKRRYCRHVGCNRIVKSQGLCQRHGAKPKKCKVDSCNKQAQGSFAGMCKAHHRMMVHDGMNNNDNNSITKEDNHFCVVIPETTLSSTKPLVSALDDAVVKSNVDDENGSVDYPSSSCTMNVVGNEIDVVAFNSMEYNEVLVAESFSEYFDYLSEII